MSYKHLETERFWHDWMMDAVPRAEARKRWINRLIPNNPRCKLCFAPFGGLGGKLLRVVLDSRPSSLNPTLCNRCENFGREHPGGAEVDLALLFADIRGSTRLAERLMQTPTPRHRAALAEMGVALTADSVSAAMPRAGLMPLG